LINEYDIDTIRFNTFRLATDEGGYVRPNAAVVVHDDVGVVHRIQYYV